MIQKLILFELFHWMISDLLINVRKFAWTGNRNSIYKKINLIRLVEKLEIGLQDSLKKIKDDNVKTLLVQNISSELEQLRNDQKPEQVFKYLSIAFDQASSLIDYFPKTFHPLY